MCRLTISVAVSRSHTPDRHSAVPRRSLDSRKAQAFHLANSLPCLRAAAMRLLLATIVQHAIDLRRAAWHLSSDTLRDLWRQAPYLTSVGGAVGIVVAVAAVRLFPATGVSGGRLRPRAFGWHAQATGEPSVRSAPPRADTATPHAIAVALALVLITIAGSQGLERLINRLLRPDAQAWTWISDVILSSGLLTMTILWTRLKQARATISTLDAQRVVLDTQLSIAADVQRALLPPIPEPIEGVHRYGSVESAGRVGGDYFDFLKLPGGKMVVVLADVSGKGIAAAIFMSNIRAIVQALVRDVSAPDELLRRLSRDVLADARAGLYATYFIVLVDPYARTMSYLNAGHPPGILTGPRGVRALRAGGPPVGLLEGATYDAETVAFDEGQMITLVSDGMRKRWTWPRMRFRSRLPRRSCARHRARRRRCASSCWARPVDREVRARPGTGATIAPSWRSAWSRQSMRMAPITLSR